MRLGKRQQAALDFISGVNGWHSFDSTVRREILTLERRSLVIVSHSTMQFRKALHDKT